jgi:hypothetical protein
MEQRAGLKSIRGLLAEDHAILLMDLEKTVP